MTTQGWPKDLNNKDRGELTAEKCLTIWNNLLNNPPPANTKCTDLCQYLVTVDEDDQICLFTDQQGNGSNVIQYNTTNGTISL